MGQAGTGGQDGGRGTALARFQRLEARGLWRDLPEAQRREVVVKLGAASLVLTDPRSDVALTHWSLPAILRLNPGQLPARYAPGEDAGEELELDDSDMMGALDTVQAALARARPRPGWLRGAIMGGVLAAVLAAAVFLLPDALVRHTAGALPEVTRAEVGRLALADLSRLTGAPCAAPAGRAALDRLAARLFPGQAPVTLAVVREGVTGALALPGRHVVLAEALLAEAEGPEVAAGHVLAAQAAAEAADPTIPLLRHAGLAATLRLLTTGRMAAGDAAGHAEALLSAPRTAVDDEALLARFRAAGLASSPYAWAVDPTGESVLGLIEADPFPAGPPRPLMSAADWDALQDICAR